MTLMSNVGNIDVGTDRSKEATKDVSLGGEPLDMDIDFMRRTVADALQLHGMTSEKAMHAFDDASASNPNPAVARFILFRLAQALKLPVIRKQA